MITLRKGLFAVGITILIGSVFTKVNAALLTLTSPVAGQAFAPNAPIGYSGQFTWDPQTGDLDKIMIEYVWTANANVAPGPGQGTLVTTQQAELVNYAMNPPGTPGSGGSSGYDNPPAPPNFVLTAKQYTLPPPMGQPGPGTVQTVTYCLRVTPLDTNGRGYFKNGNQIYIVRNWVRFNEFVSSGQLPALIGERSASSWLRQLAVQFFSW